MIFKFWSDRILLISPFSSCTPETDLCNSSPCVNGGNCSSFGSVRWECTCPIGMHGMYCENGYGMFSFDCCPLYESHHEKARFCLCENKAADQLCSNCTAVQRLCFATPVVQFLFYLYSKFQASSYPASVTVQLCVRPGRKPRRSLFFRRGS